MRMKQIKILILLCSVWHAALCLGTEKNYDAIAYNNAQLVYKNYNKSESSETINRFDEEISVVRFPSSVDLISYGSGVVIGLHVEDCYEYAGSLYLPSECGSEEILVIYLDSIPPSHDEIATEEAPDVDAVMFIGSRYGPGQGCIGYPENLSITPENVFDGIFEFYMASNFTFHTYGVPEIPCGERSIEGHFKSKINELDKELNPTAFNIFN